MIFRLKYQDGTNEIKYFNIDELFNNKIINEEIIEDYINKYLGLEEDNIESWNFIGGGDCNNVIDLRLLNYNKQILINNKVAQLELIDEGSYEYTVAIMGIDDAEDIYIKKIFIEEKDTLNNYLMDHFRKENKK